MPIPAIAALPRRAAVLCAVLMAAHVDAFAPSATNTMLRRSCATHAAARQCYVQRATPIASHARDVSGAMMFGGPSFAPTPQRTKIARTLKKDSWLANLASVPQSMVLRRIAGHLSFNVIFATAFFLLRAGGALPGFGSFSAVPHSLAGAFLGLLVTFRTNSAYARFWEARILWGGIMNTCRSLAINAGVWLKPRAPLVARQLIHELLDYPTAVMRMCRCEALKNGEHPADVCHRLQGSLHDSALPSSWEGGMGLYELQIAEQARHVDKLVDATGALNRIIQTPLPLSYSRHTSRFLTAWCTTLPFAIGPAVGLVPTLVTVVLVSWLVLGIDSIGQLLEQPFSQYKGYGDNFAFGLPVEQLAQDVCAEISRVSGEPSSIGPIG